MTKIFKKSAIVFLVFIFTALIFEKKSLLSTSPTNIKDTLSSSQLSYFARLGSGNSAGNTSVKIALTGNPSNTTNNLFVGDTIAIGNSSSTDLTKYTINGIGDTANFNITSGLSAENNLVGSAVIATRSAIHTITFTPKTTLTTGKWQFLIKASSRSGENQQDGIPDQQGFDLGQDIGTVTTGLGTRLKAADITCPFGTASVGTTAIVNNNSYHVITCSLGAGATNPIDVPQTLVIGRDLSVGSQLINPSAALNHTEGQANSSADVYNFYIRHTDSSDVVIDADTASGQIAVVESVRVTATIDPTITFSIGTSGVGVGATVCGNVLGNNATNTTSTAVSFGSVALDSFSNLAHYLSCVTNASNGYVVTVYENKPMTNISSGVTIPDTNCDSSACSTTTANEWSTVDASQSEWGYSIQNINVGTTIFNYNTSGHTFHAKSFGIGSSNAQEIMKNTSTPTQTEHAFVCYRLSVNSAQKAGTYENQLTYTATATF
jgi:hypothetical protein